jgi:hypothetical protein
MKARIEPDLRRRGAGAEVHQVVSLMLGRSRRRELVIVKIDHRRRGRDGGDEAIEIGQVHRLAGEQHIDFADPMSVELFGEPVGGGGEPAFDPPRRQAQQGPAMPAASDSRFEHRPPRPAVKRLEGEDVELGGHRYGGRTRPPFRAATERWASTPTLQCYNRSARYADTCDRLIRSCFIESRLRMVTV